MEKAYKHHRSFVGASLLAMTECQAPNRWLTLRYREQARSHRGPAFQLADCSSATPAPIRPEYGAVTSQTGMPLK